MQTNFPAIMSWLAVYEGGYVNHPRDPGGATNRGVTQAVYNAFRRSQGVQRRSVRHITDAEHDAIYTQQYWNPVRGDALPSGLDATLFDFAVNSGVSRSVKTLQRALGFKGRSVDGILGVMTLDAVRTWEAKGRISDLIIDINKRRMSFLRRLKTFGTFGVGWTRRVMGKHDGVQEDDIGVIDRSIMLYRGDLPDAIRKPKHAAPGQGREDNMGFIGRLLEALQEFFETLGRRRGAA